MLPLGNNHILMSVFMILLSFLTCHSQWGWSDTLQRKDRTVLQRIRQDVSDTQLYRAVRLLLCSGEVSFSVFRPLLVELSNLTKNNPPCFFPKLHRLLSLLQSSRQSLLCPAGFPLCWLSLLCTETTCSLTLVTLPVWHSAGLTGMCSWVSVAGHTVLRP